METLKIKKINTGYYIFEYRGYEGTISKVEGHDYWYFLLGSGDAHDWQSSFKNAKLAAMEYVDFILNNQK